MQPDLIAVTLKVIQALESLGVPYVLGGSMASTAYGYARTTLDSDIVAPLSLQQLPAFVHALREEFYLSEEAIAEAIQHRSSFNLIHLTTMFKVDIFIPKARDFERKQLANATPHLFAEHPNAIIYLASPEDTILAKLEWYRLGGELSERQWRDVVGIVQVQGERLDVGYMRHAAQELEVADLLERLLQLIMNGK